jgi:hypothetical protein
VSEEIPKQELLIKLLKMTTSSNDGEAVIAVRKANDLLKSAGWDWEKLIHGKIKVIEDPFKSVEVPINTATAGLRPKPPQRPQPMPPAQPAAAKPWPQAYGNPGNQAPPLKPYTPTPKPAKPARPVIGSNKSNIYAGWCYCCGDAVLQQGGFIFDPADHNGRARSKWMIACKSCNSSTYVNVGPSAAPRQRPLGNVAPNLNDI